jgi:DNA-binding IscR family transcriptional regulator
MKDTRFSSALHLLVLVSEAKTPMSSEQMAKSMGTNASYVRRLSGSLRKAGIVQSRKGSTGLQLVSKALELTLLDIYLAVGHKDAEDNTCSLSLARVCDVTKHSLKLLFRV